MTASAGFLIIRAVFKADQTQQEKNNLAYWLQSNIMHGNNVKLQIVRLEHQGQRISPSAQEDKSNARRCND